MPHIRNQTTLEEIKLAAPGTIWYSVSTCWWTHRQTDLRRHPNHDLPCDPRGGMLMMGPANDFLANAEANPSHYGQHGLDAFIAAHNDNCVVSHLDSRSTCLLSWQEYNDLLDRSAPPAGRCAFCRKTISGEQSVGLTHQGEPGVWCLDCAISDSVGLEDTARLSVSVDLLRRLRDGAL